MISSGEKKERYLLLSTNKKLIAPLLCISRKAVYYHKIQEEKDLIDKRTIEDLHLIHPAYGQNRVSIALGWSRNKAKRIMVKYHLKPPRRKIKPHYLTRPATNHHHYTNLIKGVTPIKPSQIFVSDLTYLNYQGKYIYLATVEDMFTREILAIKLSNRHDSALALSTIQQAINQDCHPVIFHSDQGSEFMAQAVTDYLESCLVRVSVSDKASPWQNGYKESFFGRFKDENGDFDRFDSLGELIEEIYSSIYYYNNSRIHTALKMSPAQFKRAFLSSDIVSQKSGT